jgi:endonuclease YncB( thermonuclease family)
MLRNGWEALAASTKDRIYIKAQADAQAARAGIWSNTEVVHLLKE